MLKPRPAVLSDNEFDLARIPRNRKRSFYLEVPLAAGETVDTGLMEAMTFTSYDTLDSKAVKALARREWPGRKKAVRIPVLVAKGKQPGKTLVVFAGVHPDEMEGQRALMEVYRELEPAKMSGTFLAVPVVNPLAFWTASPFNIVDRKNLARVYPGHSRGTLTERIADVTTRKFIAEADLFLDLHGGGRHYTMPTYCGYYDDGGAAGRAAHEAAVAFGAPLVWRHDSLGPGRTLGEAAGRGIPALYTECPSRGHLDPDDLRCYGQGVFNVMRHLGILPGAVKRKRVMEVNDPDSSGIMDGGIPVREAGFFHSHVKLLSRVKAGQVLGEVTDLLGNPLEQIRAHRSGRIWMMRGTPRVLSGAVAFFVGG